MINRCPLMQNNKPVKALHTHVVWKIQHSGWGPVANTVLTLDLTPHAIFATQLTPHVVFATRPHPSCCIFHIQ